MTLDKLCEAEQLAAKARDLAMQGEIELFTTINRLWAVLFVAREEITKGIDVPITDSAA